MVAAISLVWIYLKFLLPKYKTIFLFVSNFCYGVVLFQQVASVVLNYIITAACLKL